MRARDEIMIQDPRAALAHYQPMPAAMVPSAPMAQQLPEVPETSIVRAILRHFWLVVLFATIGAGGAFAFLKYAKPLYTAEAKVYIQPQSSMQPLNVALGSSQRSNYLYTQADIIRSSVILKLLPPELATLQTFEITHGDMVKYLQKELATDVDRKNDIISVAVESPYAEEAPKITNAVVTAYQQYQLADKNTTASILLKTLGDELKKTQAEKQLLDEKKVKFEAANPLVQSAAQGAFQGQFTTYLQALTQARIDSISKQAAFGPLNDAVLRAKRMEEQLSMQLEDARDQVKNSNAKVQEYLKLQGDIEERKAFIAQVTDKIKGLELAKEAQTIVNDVQVLEQATVPEKPSFPRKTRTLAAAIFVGALLGACLALVRDRMDTRMRSVEEIQTVIGLPILGVVPAMSGRRTAIARAMTVHLDPRSVVAEAYRTIRTAVYFGAGEQACKTILMTSPEPGDGKTTSASNLAIAIAQTGRSVLLLDADFRKPTQHKNLDIKDAIGLSSVLAGREPLERAIQRTGVEGLDILPCGPIPANPSEILNSREFGELIDSLAARYDHIIFDSPPVNAVTDARILGAVCDATILVMRADKSTKKAGEHARNGLLAVGARILGAIVNDAPNRKGYEVYGGSYYGSIDVRTRQADRAADPVLDGRRLPSQ